MSFETEIQPSVFIMSFGVLEEIIDSCDFINNKLSGIFITVPDWKVQLWYSEHVLVRVAILRLRGLTGSRNGPKRNLEPLMCNVLSEKKNHVKFNCYYKQIICFVLNFLCIYLIKNYMEHLIGCFSV